MSTIHIEADKYDIAKNVLMPGDPKRVWYIANTFLSDYKVVNQRRGELGVTGFYKGKQVTLFSSGMGIPSMGIYSYELFKFYEVENIIRIGTAKAEKDEYNIGDVVLVTESYSDCTYSNEIELNHVIKVSSSSYLNEKIKEKKEDIKSGACYTSLSFYESKTKLPDFISFIEMENYALFYNAIKLDKNATALLTITDSDKNTMSAEDRERALDNMITLALETIINL